MRAVSVWTIRSRQLLTVRGEWIWSSIAHGETDVQSWFKWVEDRWIDTFRLPFIIVTEDDHGYFSCNCLLAMVTSLTPAGMLPNLLLWIHFSTDDFNGVRWRETRRISEERRLLWVLDHLHCSWIQRSFLIGVKRTRMELVSLRATCFWKNL